MENQKKTKQPNGKDWKKWGEEVYLPWYRKVTAPQTQDDSGSNPGTPPPPPPGGGKP